MFAGSSDNDLQLQQPSDPLLDSLGGQNHHHHHHPDLFGSDPFGSSASRGDRNGHRAPAIDLGPLERAVNQLDGLDYGSKQLLLAMVRRLIMVINSILGLSLDKLAKYYFGPDFWYILAGRIVCLLWWAMISLRPKSEQNNNNQWSANGAATSGDERAELAATSRLLFRCQQVRDSWRTLSAWLPMSKRSLVKVLLVLAYTQMLIQQMDNKEHLAEQVDQLGQPPSDPSPSTQTGSPACCGSTSTSGGGLSSAASQTATELSSWFSCMWDSAKACSGAGSGGGTGSDQSRASRYWNRTKDNLLLGLHYLYKLMAGLDLASVYHVWLARWRSNIVQRLCQSMLVQLYYLAQVLFVYE